MKPLSRDTSPAAERILIEGYRRMTPSQKLRRVQLLSRMVQRLALADIKANHPDASERELRLRLASRSLDHDLLRKFCGWNPDIEGY